MSTSENTSKNMELLERKGLIFPVIYDPSTILISFSVNSYNS